MNKTLDLARFERSHVAELAIDMADGRTCGAHHAHRAAEQYWDLLNECKRQREQIKVLREALEAIIQWEDISKIDDEWPIVVGYARAALKATE